MAGDNEDFVPADIHGLAEQWYADKSFTVPGLVQRLPRWARMFRRFITREELEVLEIGSFEGWNTLFFTNYLPTAHVTCVDSFEESDALFDANLAEFGGRIEKITATALAALDHFVGEKRRYDIIYLDGSHSRDYVLATSLMAWLVLRKGGIIIWNDYMWGEGRPSEKRPHDAINWFLDMREADIEVLAQGNQMVVRKMVP